MSCGSSSRLVLRSQRPVVVTSVRRSSLWSSPTAGIVVPVHGLRDIGMVHGLVGINRHRAELEHRELPHVRPEAGLPVEDGTG